MKTHHIIGSRSPNCRRYVAIVGDFDNRPKNIVGGDGDWHLFENNIIQRTLVDYS